MPTLKISKTLTATDMILPNPGLECCPKSVVSVHGEAWFANRIDQGSRTCPWALCTIDDLLGRLTGRGRPCSTYNHSSRMRDANQICSKTLTSVLAGFNM